MNGFSEFAAICLISSAAAAGTYFVKGAPVRKYVCDPATLKPGEICLQQVPYDSSILWIDARPRTEWERNGLAGSILWNLDPTEDMQVFEQEAAMKILETPRVIVYCSSEACGISHQVADRIKALGLGADVSVLRGGWTALRDAGKVKAD